MPEIVIQPFSLSNSEFKRYGRFFFESNSEYRGYEKLLELTDGYNIEEYDLYEALCDGAMAGVAAVRLVDEILFFDIFVVETGFRGIGVGDKLFSEIASQVKYKDAVRYESMALPGDRSTKNFFEQRKGKARLLVVGGPIPGTA